MISMRLFFDESSRCSCFSLQEGCIPITCFYSVIVGSEDIINNRVRIAFSKEKAEKLSKEFGTYVTILTNIPQFIESIRYNNKNLKYGLVKYKSNGWKRGGEGVFEKADRFSDEKEFRIIDSKRLFALEKEKILKHSKFIVENTDGDKIYKLLNGRNITCDKNNDILSINDNGRLIILNKLDCELYSSDYICLSESDLAKDHYIAKGLDISCTTCSLQDLINGIDVNINFDRVLCEVLNYIGHGDDDEQST